MKFQYGSYTHCPREVTMSKTETGPSAFIDDGYTLDGFVKADPEKHPAVKFQYRPSLSHERSQLRRAMEYHTEDTETAQLESTKTGLQVALTSTVDATARRDIERQIAGLTEQIRESRKNFLASLEDKYKAAEMDAAVWVANHLVEWNLDAPICPDNVFKLKPELSGAIFNILMGTRKSDNPSDEKFDEGEEVKNS